MSDRRTSLRARKQVDYAHSDKDFEDDDEDFASSKSKKMQSESKQEVKEARKKENKSNCENKVPQHRLPLDEKLFERDLQAALQLSKQSREDDTDAKAAVSAKPLSTLNVHTANSADDADGNNDDDDDDYNVDGDDDDDSDDDFDCSDSDDSVAKINEKKAESKSGRGRGQAQKADVSKPAAGTKRSAAKLPGKSPKKRVGMQPSTNKGTCKLPSYSAAVKSPSSVSRVNSVMSPSSGLRLGLSRNVKVKPLHPSLHITT